MAEEGRERIEKLARSGSKNAAGAAAPVRGARGHGRRWSSSTDLDIIETAPAAPAVTARGAAVLGRSYSTTAVVAVAAAAVDDGAGGVKKEQKQQQQQQAAAREGEAAAAAAAAAEAEQRPKKRCGAGAGARRLSRKIKEHRTRFYIVRRCVAMLVCWRDDDDD